MQEAINRGVPLLGIPIFGDQSLNMRKAVSVGYGVMVEFNNVTEESLTWAIRQLLEVPKYVIHLQHYYYYYLLLLLLLLLYRYYSH
jgi:glucuronosyltransferase